MPNRICLNQGISYSGLYIGFSPKLPKYTVSPEHCFRYKKFFGLERIFVLCDGVFDAANLFFNRGSMSKSFEILNMSFAPMDESSASEIQKLKKTIAFPGSPLAPSGKTVVGFATANTPLFHKFELNELVQLLRFFIDFTEKNEVETVYSIPPKAWRQISSSEEGASLLSKVEAKNMKGSDLVGRSDAVFCTKSTLLLDAERSGKICVELVTRPIGSVHKIFKVYSEASMNVMLSALTMSEKPCTPKKVIQYFQDHEIVI